MPSPAVRADHTKGDTVQAIRAAVTRLSPISLRRLREGLFKLQLQLLEDMVVSGIDVPKVQAVSHCARAIEVVDQLQGRPARTIVATSRRQALSFPGVMLR